MTVHSIRKGLDLPLAGRPEQRIEAAAAVRAGGAAGCRHTRPAVQRWRSSRATGCNAVNCCTATASRPACATPRPRQAPCSAVHRGAQRAFLSLVIDVADDDGPAAQVAFDSLPRPGSRPADGAAVRALLLESGLWSALRTRPYSRVPAADAVPQAIFVTAHRHPPARARPASRAGRSRGRFRRRHGRHRAARAGAGTTCAEPPARASPPGRGRAPRCTNSPGRTRPARPACTSTCCTRWTPSTASGTSATRTWPPSVTCSSPDSSTSSASSRWPAPPCSARGCCARGWGPRWPS